MSDAVALREYIDALLSEKERALTMADDEREKAAAALRGELARAMGEGDDRLREHIHNQVQQINAALVSAEKLELERLNVIMRRLEGDENVVTALREANDERFHKFEKTVSDRFAQVNEFRGSLDDLGKTMATRRELDDFKTLYATAHELLRGQTVELGRRLDLESGKAQGVTATTKALVTGLSTLLVLLGIYTAFQATRNQDARTPVTTTQTQTVMQTVTAPTP